MDKKIVLPGFSLPATEVELLWKRYYELRDKDTQGVLKDKRARDKGTEGEGECDLGWGEWDLGAGEVPEGKRRRDFSFLCLVFEFEDFFSGK